jgi:hypothetical protein
MHEALIHRASCHPERSRLNREADQTAQSKDPYTLPTASRST